MDRQPDLYLTGRKYVEKVKRIALNGTPRQAKFAARFTAYCGHEGASEDLVEVRLAGYQKASADR
jgi:hypothetical protein